MVSEIFCTKNISLWRLIKNVERIKQYMTLQCKVCFAGAMALPEAVYFRVFSSILSVTHYICRT